MHEAPGTGRELKKAHTVTLPDKLAVKDEYKKTPPLAACFSEVDYNFAIFAFLFSLSLCYSNFVSGFFFVFNCGRAVCGMCTKRKHSGKKEQKAVRLAPVCLALFTRLTDAKEGKAAPGQKPWLVADF